MHPAHDICASKSTLLSGKKIILAVTGSIAAVETIKIARELIRHGADVIPIMTKAATEIIHPYALEFATGHPPITQLTGQTEHVCYCGKTAEHADLLLIIPCTANTIAKIAHGIDDTAVTTFATTALGSHIPIIIAPAMHHSMYDHTIMQHNIQQLKNQHITIIEPIQQKNKVKLPASTHIVPMVLRMLGPQDLSNQTILIIGGSTAEPIDDIRIMTTNSSGKTAIALSINAYLRGANVQLLLGNATEQPPSYIPTTAFHTTKQLQKIITDTKTKYTTIINCAAIADYIPQSYKGKIPSNKDTLHITCTPAQKMLPLIKKHHPHAKIIAFKAENSKKDLQQQGKNLLNQHNLHAVIANTTQAFQKDSTSILIIQKNKKTKRYKGSKRDLAGHILNTLP